MQDGGRPRVRQRSKHAVLGRRALIWRRAQRQQEQRAEWWQVREETIWTMVIRMVQVDDDFKDGGFKTGQGGFHADYELSSYSSYKHLNQ